jgi:hypothetical protein
MKRLSPFGPLLAVVALAACGGSDPCAVVTCSSHGTCAVAGSAAICACDSGYHASGLSCLIDDPCEGETCSSHGTCVAVGSAASCACNYGYYASGMSCLFDTSNPCTNPDYPAHCSLGNFCCATNNGCCSNINCGCCTATQMHCDSSGCCET